MKRMNRIAAAVIAVLLSAAALVSCGPEPLGMYPVYMGPETVPLGYEFTKDDFYVTIAFDDGTDRVVDDFEFVIEGAEAGEYMVNIIYEDVEYPVFVPIDVAVYPSELGGSAE